jgi:hypothetical protein
MLGVPDETPDVQVFSPAITHFKIALTRRRRQRNGVGRLARVRGCDMSDVPRAAPLDLHAHTLTNSTLPFDAKSRNAGRP